MTLPKFLNLLVSQRAAFKFTQELIFGKVSCTVPGCNWPSKDCSYFVIIIFLTLFSGACPGEKTHMLVIGDPAGPVYLAWETLSCMPLPPHHPIPPQPERSKACCVVGSGKCCRQLGETQAMQLVGRGFRKRIQNHHVGDIGRGLPWLVRFLSFVANLQRCLLRIHS